MKSAITEVEKFTRVFKGRFEQAEESVNFKIGKREL